jgi:chromosome segregation ATPase
MAETSNDELRQAFFSLFSLSSNEKAARKWAQDRIRHLEQQAETIKAQLVDRNKAIDSLKEENARLTERLSRDPAVESYENRHQRHRRERMLDEVTLICVQARIRHTPIEDIELDVLGDVLRGLANEICNGINYYDA